MNNKFYEWVAYRLPKKLVYWCAIRLGAFGTTGNKYGNTEVTSVRFTTLLNRWEQNDK